jgi:hypothetical protein
VRREPNEIEGAQHDDADSREDDQPEDERRPSPIDLVGSPHGYDPGRHGADNPLNCERHRSGHEQHGET